MTKELHLTKAHLRKNRGTSVGIFLLMMIASLLLSVSMVLFTDVYPTADRESDNLNAGDGIIRISKSPVEFDRTLVEETLGDCFKEFDVARTLEFKRTAATFGDSEVTVNVLIGDSSLFNKTMSRTEVVEEDKSLEGSGIYLPYQFHTTCGYEVGDGYHLNLPIGRYDFVIKGFLKNTYFGCNNSGTFEMIVDDDIYASMLSLSDPSLMTSSIPFVLKDDVKFAKFSVDASDRIYKVSPEADVYATSLSNSNLSRGFMSLIIAVSLLTVTVIVILVIILMIANSIGNYVKENMKTIGALKAIGYTGGSIKASVILMFLILAVIASLIGTALSYIAIPFVAKVVIAQMGLPYTSSFSLIPTLTAFFAVVVFTVIATILSLRKISRIVPITALRDGIENHNFKRNPIKLDRTGLSLNAGLSLKTTFSNLKQNIITFAVTSILIFLCVISLLMYENFNRNPKLDIMTLETCSGAVGVDPMTASEARDSLTSRSDITNVRETSMLYIYYKDENRLYLNIFEDFSAMNNKSVCYDGRLPEHDNEVCVSGRFAKGAGYGVGDEIELHLGEKSFSYIISGLMQTTNNGGEEALMTYEAADRIMDTESLPRLFYFDLVGEETEANIDSVLDDCERELSGHMTSRVNFLKTIEGSMQTFKGISTMMLVIVSTIAVLVVLLVLYLLIRSLIFSKRRDYGIYKALGYTSRDLIIQTAMSFMPSIILATVFSSIASYFLANPYMSVIMVNFYLMQCDFSIPIPGVIIIALVMILLSLIFSIFESRKIRKIEAYNMLVAE